MTDFEIVTKYAQKPNSALLSILYKTYTPLFHKSYYTFFRMYSDTYPLEDFLQDVYIVLLSSVNHINFSKIYAPDTWKLYDLLSFNLRKFRNAKYKEFSRTMYAEIDEEMQNSPVFCKEDTTLHLIEEEYTDTIHAFCQSLPSKAMRETFLYRIQYNTEAFTLEEIAAKQGVTKQMISLRIKEIQKRWSLFRAQKERHARRNSMSQGKRGRDYLISGIQIA